MQLEAYLFLNSTRLLLYLAAQHAAGLPQHACAEAKRNLGSSAQASKVVGKIGKSFSACRAQLPFMSKTYMVEFMGPVDGSASTSAGNATVMGVTPGVQPWQAGVSGGGGMEAMAASMAAAMDSRVLSSPAHDEVGSQVLF